jgi:hydroxymethylglutaryl-CoA reductase
VKTSDISGFYKHSLEERLKIVTEFGGLTDAEAAALATPGALPPDLANRMIENVVGTMPIPLGIAVNFTVNGRDVLVPMAIEEPSVVAASSNAARMARAKGGFAASTTAPIMIGQIQLVNVHDPHGAKMTVLHHRQKILDLCNEKDPILVKLGGGAKDVEVRVLHTARGAMVIVHLLVDCRDAMGANAVNTMAEAAAPFLEEITGGRVYLRIISNLAVKRLARARAVFAAEAIGGPDVVDGILEAGAHAYAAWAYGPGYHSLTKWEKNADGDLVGTIELPMAVGLVGGATAVHPTAKANVKLLGVKTAGELAEIIASVGLAQNFAALRALATEGIQRGHMGLHARNIAATVGATGDEIDRVAEVLVKERKVRMDRAKEVLDEIRSRT